MNIQLSEWDSEFFQMKIGKVELKPSLDLQSLKEEFIANHYDLLYLFQREASKSLSGKISALGGLHVDNKILFEADLEYENITDANDASILLYDSPQISAGFYSIARQTAAYSRFKTDANFDPEAYIKLYDTWLERSIDKSIADDILVYKADGQVAGFVTLKLHADKLTIGLFGVNLDHRGTGIGSKLMHACFQYAKSHQRHKIEVATQEANKAAVNFYKKNGFAVKDNINIYHLWRSN